MAKRSEEERQKEVRKGCWVLGKPIYCLSVCVCVSVFVCLFVVVFSVPGVYMYVSLSLCVSVCLLGF